MLAKAPAFDRCPKCGHISVKQFDELEVIGVTQCVKGNKAIMKKRQYGIKCLLCNYNNSKIMVVDHHGHRVA
jgi:hypothetical protein